MIESMRIEKMFGAKSEVMVTFTTEHQTINLPLSDLLQAASEAADSMVSYAESMAFGWSVEVVN